MSDQGKTNIVILWTIPPEDVAEGDRMFASHARWMRGHPREGDEALLAYRISKGPQLEDPTDPNSAPTGNTVFVLHEIYETPAGVPNHWKLAMESWEDLPAFMVWSKGRATTLHSGTIVHSLW